MIFCPAFTEEAFFEFLLKRKNGREQMTCADYLLGIFHRKLIPRFLEQARIRMHTLTGDLSDTQIKSLVQVVKNNVVTIDTTNGFDNAQVCAGGISTEEITPDTMESRYVRHLYLAGGIAGCGRHLRRVQSAMGLGDRLSCRNCCCKRYIIR